MSAVPAFPDFYFTLREDLLCFHIFQKGAIALLMVLLDFGNQAELCSQFRESFFFRCFSEAFIHISPLVILSGCGSREVLRCGADPAKLLKPQFCVFLLIVRGFQEQCRNLFKSVLLRAGSKISIFVSCLALAGKGRKKVLFRLGSGIRIALWSLSRRRGIRLPESVEIAIFIGGHNLISIRQGKHGLRLITGFKLFSLPSFFCFQQNPLNIVSVKHRMLHRTDRNGDDAAIYGNHRHMLFTGCIGSVWQNRLHLFAAAYAADAGVMNMGNDIPAMGTFVECHLFSFPNSFRILSENDH